MPFFILKPYKDSLCKILVLSYAKCKSLSRRNLYRVNLSKITETHRHNFVETKVERKTYFLKSMVFWLSSLPAIIVHKEKVTPFKTNKLALHHFGPSTHLYWCFQSFLHWSIFVWKHILAKCYLHALCDRAINPRWKYGCIRLASSLYDKGYD